MLKIYTRLGGIRCSTALGIRFGGHRGGSYEPAPTAIEVSDSGATIVDHSFALGSLVPRLR
jgi:hypothetical protein